MNMLLRDISFPVREATISGYMLNPDWLNKYGKDENPGLCWEIVVQTEELPHLYDLFPQAPRLTLSEFSLPISQWLDLEGQTVHSNAANAISYFWTHETISSSTLKIGKRIGNKFSIHWEGTCDPMLEAPYDKGVPFIIETEATFKEISIQASRTDTDATTLERLSKYLDPANLIQHQMKEIVRNDPVQYHCGIFDSLRRWFFRFPVTRRTVQRYTIFEPRI